MAAAAPDRSFHRLNASRSKLDEAVRRRLIARDRSCDDASAPSRHEENARCSRLRRDLDPSMSVRFQQGKQAHEAGIPVPVSSTPMPKWRSCPLAPWRKCGMKPSAKEGFTLESEGISATAAGHTPSSRANRTHLHGRLPTWLGLRRLKLHGNDSNDWDYTHYCNGGFSYRVHRVHRVRGVPLFFVT